MTPVTPEIIAVLGLVFVALVLFATEPVRLDIIAISLMVTLMLFGPVTKSFVAVGVLSDPILLLNEPIDGVSGFSNTATMVILSMFVLSEGIRRTGFIKRVAEKLSECVGDDEGSQLAGIMGTTIPISGFIGNTAAVAILVPMVTDLADRGGNSPSKLLIPLSYASMFGGTLTLIGTSTNVLASEIAAREGFLGQPFSVFQFTHVGIIVSIVGGIYLFFVGRRLLPERIEPNTQNPTKDGLGEYMTEIVVPEHSSFVGRSVRALLVDTDLDVDLLHLIRDDVLKPLGSITIRSDDVFAVRADRETLADLVVNDELELAPEASLDGVDLAPRDETTLVELIVSRGSSLAGTTLESVGFYQRYGSPAFALRRGKEVIRERMEHSPIQPGDALLVQATAGGVSRFTDNTDFVVGNALDRPALRDSKLPIAVGIVGVVVLLAVLGITSMMVAALTGSLLMVLCGCLNPSEMYDAVQWDVILLIASVIPLGLAMEKTGAALLIAELITQSASFLPPIAVLGLFYLVTALLTNLISNQASVVLMVPIAFEAAVRIGSVPISFILAVMFAASTAFTTPIGYQTNPLVYSPGGYRFSDFITVGGPLQLLLAVVTTVSIAVFLDRPIPNVTLNSIISLTGDAETDIHLLL